MSFKKRSFSLDSSAFLGANDLTSSRRSSLKMIRPLPSVDESPHQLQELSQQGPGRFSHREVSITEESYERPDVNSNIAKQNKSFHKLFPEIPDEESSTNAFTCALQKDGLYQGKLFVSENNVCFHSSVLKETKLVIPLSMVRQVKKLHSAMSLSIQTADGEKYLFVSLMNRGMCYKLLQRVCSHARVEESTNSSPRVSCGENDFDVISSNSSIEDSFSNHPSRENRISYDNAPQLQSTVRSRVIHPVQAEVDRGVFGRISSLFTTSEIRNLQILFQTYIILMLLLLLTSGYIGLRIIALEDVLSHMDSHHTQYNET
uniref:GRAM domain-containing protein n=1 Tax=Knipowitschia caucasica TaxID=637954 RepID=A0AAV2JT78_KNICA